MEQPDLRIWERVSDRPEPKEVDYLVAEEWARNDDDTVLGEQNPDLN
ncbi:MAG: hypothetical protein WA376_05935 [Terrimicrobiaceae bacterium]